MSDFHKLRPYFHIPQFDKVLDICTIRFQRTAITSMRHVEVILRNK